MSSSTVNDPGLNSVSMAAELLWTKICRCVDGHWRFSDDVEVIRGTCLAKRHSFRAKQVALCLDELRAAGAIVYRKSTDGKSWIEIADHLRHRSQTRYRDPRWGVTAAPAEEQSELALGPLALSPPPPSRTSKEKEIKRVLAPSLAKESDLLEEVRIIVGDGEIKLNGGMWRLRIRHSAKAVRFAIEDWKVRTPEQQRTVSNPGAWLTDRYQRALVELSGRLEVARHS